MGPDWKVKLSKEFGGLFELLSRIFLVSLLLECVALIALGVLKLLQMTRGYVPGYFRFWVWRKVVGGFTFLICKT